MATTINWVIEFMQCKPKEGDLTDVVIICGWRCNGTDGTYNGTVYGTCTFNGPGSDFIPYESLTEQVVLGWVWGSGVDKDATEAAVAKLIENQINPPVVQPPLPWDTPAPAPAA